MQIKKGWDWLDTSLDFLLQVTNWVGGVVIMFQEAARASAILTPKHMA